MATAVRCASFLEAMPRLLSRTRERRHWDLGLSLKARLPMFLLPAHNGGQGGRRNGSESICQGGETSPRALGPGNPEPRNRRISSYGPGPDASARSSLAFRFTRVGKRGPIVEWRRAENPPRLKTARFGCALLPGGDCARRVPYVQFLTVGPWAAADQKRCVGSHRRRPKKRASHRPTGIITKQIVETRTTA